MKKLVIVILGFCISIGAVARPLTESERVAVEKAVREEMKDPDSAKFYHGDFPYPDNTFIYCGYVNAKNSYGAYTGKQLFATFVAVNKDKKTVAASFDTNSQTGAPTEPSVLASICANAGYDLPISKLFFKDVNKNRHKFNIPPLSERYLIP